MTPPTSSQPCVCHPSKTGRCSTNAQYTELHHVIPQAWQNWKLKAEKLFDARTVPICPTGHRNVHFWLVRLTKATPGTVLDEVVSSSKARSRDRDDAALHLAYERVRAQAKKDGRIINKREMDMALLAVQRWIEAGNTIGDLVANKMWGEA